MLLNVDAVNCHYGNAQVLHDVSVSVAERELVCIVGRNGAGKTTLLKTIGGFITPTRGTVTFEEKPIGGMRPDKVALLGVKYVFQDKRVFGDLTVRDNIELAAYPIKANVDEAVGRLFSIS
jgi:branched-chain amino acid transport system ATP-binding protein